MNAQVKTEITNQTEKLKPMPKEKTFQERVEAVIGERTGPSAAAAILYHDLDIRVNTANEVLVRQDAGQNFFSLETGGGQRLIRRHLVKTCKDLSKGFKKAAGLSAYPKELYLKEVGDILRISAPEERIKTCQRTAMMDKLSVFIDSHTPEFFHLTPDGVSRVGSLPSEVNFVRPNGDHPIVVDEALLNQPIDFEALKADLSSLMNMQYPQLYPVLAALLAYFWIGNQARKGRPSVPMPIMWFKGEKGSGKSTMADFTAELLDPGTESGAQVRALTNDDELYTLLVNSRLLLLDNIRKFSPEQSDVLCKLSTGASLRLRKLYSDSLQNSLRIVTPIIITSILDCIDQPDLASRTLCFSLEVIKDAEGDEVHEELMDIDTRFQKMKPRLMSTLLNLIVASWRNRQSEQYPKPTGLPRLTDFAIFAYYAAPEMGIEPEEMMELIGLSQELAASGVKKSKQDQQEDQNQIRWQGLAQYLAQHVQSEGELSEGAYSLTTTSTDVHKALASQMAILGIDSSRKLGRQMQLGEKVLNEAGIIHKSITNNGRKLVLTYTPPAVSELESLIDEFGVL